LKVKTLFVFCAGVGVLLLLVFCAGACRSRIKKRFDFQRQETSGTASLQEKSAVTLTIKGNRIEAEVAATPEKQTQGLSFRTALHPDSGMIFVFENEQTLRFWMKNTYIPLAIAFIDKQGVITDVMEMAPLDTETRYQSSRPASYALEVNSGWFLIHNVKPGDTVLGLPVPSLIRH
jgi:uncharacterized membrane protein (UPF0127 family)